MSKMLPIPAPIIGSTGSSSSASVFCSNSGNRRFIISFIYFGGIASLCYLFLFALVVSNNLDSQTNSRHPLHNQTFNRKPFGGSGIFQYLTQNSVKQSYLSKVKGAASTYSNHTSDNHLQLPFRRKTLYTLSKTRNKHRKDGTWRSYPTKVWSGHQDLINTVYNFHKDRKGYDDKSKPTDLSEAYLYPWIDDEQCKRFNVKFAQPDTFKPRALVSFPGSGNSWLRYLIQCATGYFTGSVYKDKTLYSLGLWGEFLPPDDGSTILQKTHHIAIGNQTKSLLDAQTLFQYRGILIIRNPYDALVSWWHFIHNNKHVKNRHKGIAKEASFYTVEWLTFVRKNIALWTSLITTWLENSQDYLILLYEDVQKNPRQQLIEILGYLGHPVDSERLDCLMKPEHLEGPFHRAHTTSPPSPPSSKSTVTASSKSISQHTTSSQQQLQRGKRELPSPLPHQHHSDEQTPFILDSTKKSQHSTEQHQHLQSPFQTITVEVNRRKTGEEQKEDKFLLSKPPPALSSSALPSKMISSTPSPFIQQNPDQPISSSRIKSRSINNISNNDNHHDRNNKDKSNNHLNNSSILRLDLIIQDNIDKINRFFQEKNIPLQLLYTLRPSIKSYFLLPLLNITTLSVTSTSNIFGL